MRSHALLPAFEPPSTEAVFGSDGASVVPETDWLKLVVSDDDEVEVEVEVEVDDEVDDEVEVVRVCVDVEVVTVLVVVAGSHTMMWLIPCESPSPYVPSPSVSAKTVSPAATSLKIVLS